jgi:uncharacterized protein (TIGR03546 family)
MILWTIKQLFSLKKALTGRANPSELAWGLALGLAIGLVPKGNLVSIVLIGLLVSLRVNHGMAALAAVMTSFLAIRFDPWTHQLGADILQSQRVRETMERWWDAPLVPWTDLNNTVVMGSTVIGLVSVVPTYLISMPIFRWMSPRSTPSLESDPPPAESIAVAMEPATKPIEAVAAVQPHLQVYAAPTAKETSTSNFALENVGASASLSKEAGHTELKVAHSDSPHSAAANKIAANKIAANDTAANKTAANESANNTAGTSSHGANHAETLHTETQIEIIRMRPKTDVELGEQDDSDDKNGPMNEALGYLLRRLRDSRQGKAA